MLLSTFKNTNKLYIRQQHWFFSNPASRDLQSRLFNVGFAILTYLTLDFAPLIFDSNPNTTNLVNQQSTICKEGGKKYLSSLRLLELGSMYCPVQFYS